MDPHGSSPTVIDWNPTRFLPRAASAQQNRRIWEKEETPRLPPAISRATRTGERAGRDRIDTAGDPRRCATHCQGRQEGPYRFAVESSRAGRAAGLTCREAFHPAGSSARQLGNREWAPHRLGEIAPPVGNMPGNTSPPRPEPVQPGQRGQERSTSPKGKPAERCRRRRRFGRPKGSYYILRGVSSRQVDSHTAAPDCPKPHSGLPPCHRGAARPRPARMPSRLTQAA